MERKWHCLAEEEAWDGTERALTAYGVPLSKVTIFKYLGRFLASEDNDWPAVVRNLRIVRQKWARLTRVLSREGADAQKLGQIYLVVVQSVLIYGPETWVLTPHMQRVLGGFHHRVARRLTGGNCRRDGAEARFAPLWRMRWWRRGYRRWRPTSLAARTPWRNILRLSPLWTCVWRQSGCQGQEWQCSGMNRRVWIWRGFGQRPMRRSRQRGGRIRTGRRLRLEIIKFGRIL